MNNNKQVTLRLTSEGADKLAAHPLPFSAPVTDEQAPRPISHRKAGPIQLPDPVSAEEAFIFIIRACLGHWRANLAAARAGQIEGVHQMRVALRRLRSCLRVFRSLIPRQVSADLVAEIRWLNRSLGSTRDWDVFIHEGLNPLCARFSSKRRLHTLHHKAETLRQAHYQALCHCLDDPRYRRLILRLYGWLDCKSWRQGLSKKQQAALDQPAVKFATSILKRTHRRIVKEGEGFAQLSVEQRHKLRIRIKRLRYTLEFFTSCYPAHAVARYRTAVAGLQDILGAMNDVTVVERLLNEARLGKATATRYLIEGWYAGKLDSYEQRFPKTWKRFQACKRPWK